MSWSRFELFENEDSSHAQDVYARQTAHSLASELNLSNKNVKMYITGHSLGGRLSLISNEYFQQKLLFSQKIEKTVTFNALGVFGMKHNKAYEGNNINYVISGEMLSSIGFGPQKNERKLEIKTVSDSSKKHDLYHFWQHIGVQGE